MRKRKKLGNRSNKDAKNQQRKGGRERSKREVKWVLYKHEDVNARQRKHRQVQKTRNKRQ
jgi:hypothetical protein